MNDVLLELALSSQKGNTIQDNLYYVFEILKKHLPISQYGLWVGDTFLEKKSKPQADFVYLGGSITHHTKGEKMVLPKNTAFYFKNEGGYMVITNQNPDFYYFFEQNGLKNNPQTDTKENSSILLIFALGKHLLLKVFLEKSLQAEEKKILNQINPILQHWKNTLKKMIRIETLKKDYNQIKEQKRIIINKISKIRDKNITQNLPENNMAEIIQQWEKNDKNQKTNQDKNLDKHNVHHKNSNENGFIPNSGIQKYIYAEKQNQILQIWLNQFRDAVCVTDKLGNVIFVNQEACNHFGYNLETLLNNNVLKISSNFKSKAEWDVFFQHLQKKKSFIFETAHITPKGRIFPVEIYAQYIHLTHLSSHDPEIEKLYAETNEYVIFVAKDISDIQNAQNIILKKQTQLNSFINTAPASVVMFDKNFNYVLGTEQWLQENNFKEYNIIGKSYQEICTNYPAHWAETLKKCLNEGTTEKRKQEKIIVAKNNDAEPEIKWVKWEFKPWYNAQKEIQGVIMLIEDITQRKHEADMLRLAKQKAEEASQAKHLFLANVSHEIRTPLHVMGGMMQLLHKTPLEDGQKQYMDTIRSAMDNLLVIVNDILDISKIEAGKITLENIGFNLRDLVQHLCLLLKHRADEKEVGLFYEIDRKIAPVLIGDSVRINQILLNFVNNAIKFTNKGSVEIECQMVSQTPTHQKIVFRIIDTGKGIAENKLQQIFEKFTQEDESINREYGGTGLGLSISKQLTELMGGKIQVQSKRSIGTTFWFELELPIGSENQIPKKQKIDTSLNQLQGMKVLLAEDHDINRFLATTILQNWGIKVDIAENGREAVDKVSQNQYDAVLMDIQMPIMGGIEATRIIRHQLKSDVPIIALTAHAFKGEKERYLSAGMNDYVSKPFEADELYVALLHFRKPNAPAQAPQNTKYDEIKNQETQKQEKLRNADNISPKTSKNYTENPPQLTQDMQKDEYVFDLDILRRTLNNDEMMTEKMVLMFVEKTPNTITELQQALQQHDRTQIKAIAHKLKSSFKLMGMTSLADIALFLEQSSANADLATLQDNVKNLVRIFGVIVEKIKN